MLERFKPNPYTGKPMYYKDNPEAQYKRNSQRMWVTVDTSQKDIHSINPDASSHWMMLGHIVRLKVQNKVMCT